MSSSALQVVWVQQTERGSYVKVRLFFLLVIAAASIMLVTVGAASGAKPPKQPKQPPPGTRGVAATVGTPGTITITHYTEDGLTVLGTERYRATESDRSASIAARAGKVAPGAVKAGAVTEWDDLGRPDAPVAQVESPAGVRTTSALKRSARKADCCSSSGCDAIDVTRDITG